MLQKEIRFLGRPLTVACDGRCDKAWGMNTRPKLYFIGKGPPKQLKKRDEPPDWDDYVYVADGALGTAPADPGTTEGDCGKPSAVPLKDSSLMNKWCARECERSQTFEPGEPIIVPDLANPQPNKHDRSIMGIMDRWIARPVESRQSVQEELRRIAESLRGDEKHQADADTLQVILDLLLALR